MCKNKPWKSKKVPNINHISSKPWYANIYYLYSLKDVQISINCKIGLSMFVLSKAFIYTDNSVKPIFSAGRICFVMWLVDYLMRGISRRGNEEHSIVLKIVFVLWLLCSIDVHLAACFVIYIFQNILPGFLEFRLQNRVLRLFSWEVAFCSFRVFRVYVTVVLLCLLHFDSYGYLIDNAWAGTIL